MFCEGLLYHYGTGLAGFQRRQIPLSFHEGYIIGPRQMQRRDTGE
jgi:hypothetical protein